mmetsp:Transcript_24427/g.73373  ORF Transcript_24427/g.73373 Transcript_24427/m.73373 type:complete len:206 (+) Transcript_24427:148-765(+)
MLGGPTDAVLAIGDHSVDLTERVAPVAHRIQRRQDWRRTPGLEPLAAKSLLLGGPSVVSALAALGTRPCETLVAVEVVTSAAANVLIVATPVALQRKPSAGVTTIASEHVRIRSVAADVWAAGLRVAATPFLFGRCPPLFPPVAHIHAVVPHCGCRGRGPGCRGEATNASVLATPCPLRVGPLVHVRGVIEQAMGPTMSFRLDQC